MVIAIDLSHTSRWHVDLSLGRLQQAARFSDLGYLGHWSALAADLGAELRSLDGTWPEDALADVDLLILPLPEGETDRALTPREQRLLAGHLRAGRGILMFGGAEPPRSGDHVAAVTATSTITVGDVAVGIGHRIYSRSEPDRPHVLARDLTVAIESDHAVVAGVDNVRLHLPRRVEWRPAADAHAAATRRPPTTGCGTVLVAVDGEPVMIGGEVGGGRLAVVGNVEMFLKPFVGMAENARLFVNQLQWLRGVDSEEHAARRAADRATYQHHGPSRALPLPGDITLIDGDHLVDTALDADVFHRVASTGTPDPYREPAAFLQEAELRYAELPSEVRKAVGRFSRDSNDYGVLLIRNLPMGEVPPTPSDPHTVVRKPSWLSELWLAIFGHALGTPFSYRQERGGALYQNVVPTPHNADKLSSESSALLLDYHTETAFHPFKPDFVMLCCLRPDHDKVARTISAGVRMMLSLLTPRERAVLHEPLYRTGIDYSFGSANGQKGNGPVLRILDGDPFDPTLNYDLDLMVAETDEAEVALRSLRRAAAAVGSWANLDRGDLLIVDNRRAVHARSEFRARYDGNDRWLQRMCVAVDIDRSAAHRRAGSSVIETVFSV